jgi:hypothetical protein
MDQSPVSSRRSAPWRTAATATAVAAMVWLLFTYTHETALTWESWSVFAGAWLAFAAAAWLVRGVPKRAAALLILGGCLLGGLAAASGPPQQSDDLYRYIWDGQVQAAGIDPYAYVPAAPQLAALREDSFLWPERPPSGVSRRARRTLISRRPRARMHPDQPPERAHHLPAGRRGVLLRGRRALPARLALQADAARRRAARVRHGRGPDARPALARTRPAHGGLWAWCPVVLFESGSGAHIDVLAAFFAVCALVVLARDRGVPGRGRAARIIGGVLLGLAIGAKLTPALAAPAALRRRTLTAGTAAAATFALTYLPHVLAVGGKVIGYIPGYLNEQGYASGRGFLVLSMILPQSLCAAAAVLITAAAAARRVLPRRPVAALARSAADDRTRTVPDHARLRLVHRAAVRLRRPGRISGMARPRSDHLRHPDWKRRRAQ